jgi:putative tricarboxylic transport membrane protein
MNPLGNEGIGGIVLFLFGGLTFVLSMGMPIGHFRAAGTGLFPMILGILLMVLSGFFLAGLVIAKRKSPAAPAAIPAETPFGRQWMMFLGATVLAVALFDTLGFPLTVFVLMALLLKSLGMKRWGWIALLSMASAASAYVLFVKILKIPLPAGLPGL